MVAWNRLAEQRNQFLAKGQLVYAEGRIHTHTWEGQDDRQHFRTEVIANRVIFLNRPTSASFPEDRVDDRGGGADLDPDITSV